MTTGGWIMIAISWIVIFSLVIFCYGRIFGVKSDNIKGPLDIETETSD